MSYSNAVFYLDFEGGSDSARTALTTVTVSNPSGTITRCNKTAHGLVTGAVVDLTLFSTWLNEAWKITVVDADNFDLDGAVWQATADTSGTATPRGGSSKADAWATMNSGATAARIAPGDTIRIMASPDQTLVGNATWTQYSKTVTLAGAVTANITDCETAWTGSTNVTQTADTAQFKEGTKSAKSVIAAAFTTGKVAYFATGTLDLSTYQQVSFWIRNTVAITTGMLELRLCSDTTGDTAVNTVAIPAIPSTSQWVPITVDLAGNLGSAIASISLYANTDPGSNTINLDNILACKASSSADALSLTSLIGKVWNLSWSASTAYSLNDIRRPTQPNRNGYCYKVTTAGTTGASEPTWPQEYGQTVTDGSVVWTCLDIEETWYPIQSVNGTTVLIDNATNTLGSAGRGYDGTSETVATYKRETIKLPMATGALSGNEAKDSGAAASPITYSGGWSRTDMTTQTGETWLDGQNGLGFIVGTYSGGSDYVAFTNINGVRASYGLYVYLADFITARGHFVGCVDGVRFTGVGYGISFGPAVISSCSSDGFLVEISTQGQVSRLRASNNLGSGVTKSTSGRQGGVKLDDVVARNNATYGCDSQNFSSTDLRHLRTAGNATAGLSLAGPFAHLYNCKIEEATEFAALTPFADQYIYSIRHDQTADNHVITTDGGTITSATDQRHTASGISWKFLPTSTNRHVLYPLRLSVAKLVVNAGAQVTLSIWTRRDSTDIKGQLVVRGGQIAGVPTDVTVACEPTINTWAQSSNLTFTPTEAGVVEVLFLVWDGVGTTNGYWIDDFSSAQA